MPSGERRCRALRPAAGYNLVFLIMVFTVIGIGLASVLPYWSAVIQRDKEEELIFRGYQYAEAIRVFQQRFGRPPTRLEELLKVEPRSIRRLWDDPMTKGGKWSLIFGSQQGQSQVGQVPPGQVLPGADDPLMQAFGAPQQVPPGGQQVDPLAQALAGQGPPPDALDAVLGGGFAPNDPLELALSGGFAPDDPLEIALGGQQNQGQAQGLGGLDALDLALGEVNPNPQQPGPGRPPAGQGAGETLAGGLLAGGSDEGEGEEVVQVGPIQGVQSKSPKEGFRLFQGRRKYNRWRFTADMIPPVMGKDGKPRSPYVNTSWQSRRLVTSLDVLNEVEPPDGKTPGDPDSGEAGAGSPPAGSRRSGQSGRQAPPRGPGGDGN